jgi:Glycosyl transferase family 2
VHFVNDRSGESWWRQAYQAVVQRIVTSLHWRLQIDEMKSTVRLLEQQVRKLSPAISSWEVTSWIEQATLSETPLISIILATRNRSEFLRRAVASVCAQDYPCWELVLVDDGSTDETPDVIKQLHAALGGERLRALRICQKGVCAARNHGIAAARGEIIVYLDDDNTMHRLWLKSVAWAFLQRPEIDVVYGGIMVDDFGRLNHLPAGRLPSFHLNPFEAEALREYNLADIGAIAHRRNLPEARFDESLEGLGDWDLLTRLTREKSPLVLPVTACFYTTSAPNRLSEKPSFAAEIKSVQERLKR